MPRPPTKAQNLADLLGARILDSIYKAGEWLPGERELSAEHELDRSTVRRALRILADQGLVLLKGGVGAQVRDSDILYRNAADVAKQVGNWRGIHVSIAQAGQEPFTNTTIEETVANVLLAKWLGVPTGTALLERARVQGIVGDPPIHTATTWLPPETVSEFPVLRQVNTGPGGLYSRFEEQATRFCSKSPLPAACHVPPSRKS